MARKRKRQAEEPVKGDMTPMIDIVFQLLIFFMLTIEFKTLEGKLAANLPKDVGVNASDAEPKEKVEIRIKVANPGNKVSPDTGEAWDGQGMFKYVDRQLVYSVGPKSMRTLPELARRLAELYRADPEQAVTIAPYPQTVYEDVVGVLDEVVAAEFTDVTFMGALPETAK